MQVSVFSRKNLVVLASMMKGGNRTFRKLAAHEGAHLVFGPMAFATNIVQKNPYDLGLITPNPDLGFQGRKSMGGKREPFIPQIAGSQVADFCEAAKIVQENIFRCTGQVSFDGLNINSGCPQPFILKKDSGVALLKDSRSLGTLAAAVAALKKILGDTPVTVKIRTGYDLPPLAPSLKEIIQTLEHAGTDAVILHARFREDRYNTRANWDHISRAIEYRDRMPIIGNGDIFSVEDYQRMVEETHCEGVALGRGALLRPWIFSEIISGKTTDLNPLARARYFGAFFEQLEKDFSDDLLQLKDLARFHMGWFFGHSMGTDFQLWNGEQFFPDHFKHSWPTLKKEVDSELRALGRGGCDKEPSGYEVYAQTCRMLRRSPAAETNWIRALGKRRNF